MKRRTQKLKNLTYWSLFLIIAFTLFGMTIGIIEAYESEYGQYGGQFIGSHIPQKNSNNAQKQTENIDSNGSQEENPLCDLEAVICPNEKQGTIESLIAHYSDIYNFNKETALRIADCESKTGKYLYNFSGSSAKGIYQFTNATWKNYCKGDVLNADDNIKCFLELYNKHPEWWECA
jgi:hypothetical protein